LNRAEVMFRNGQYLQQPQFPSLIGYEASGTVEEVGPGVTGFKVGDRVSSVPSFYMTEYGTYGEVAILPDYSLASCPDGLDFVQAASIWMQYLTAFGLIQFGNMSRGDFVLITAAGSSVGVAAIQLANAVGAIPIATTRSKAKEAALSKEGAKHVVNTGAGDWVSRVREITADKGVDLAFDPVAGPELEQVARCMRSEGTVFVYGALSPDPTPFPLFAAIGNNIVFRGYNMFSIVQDPARFEPAKKSLLEHLAAGTLKPVIARTFKLDQIVEAHRYMESNDQIGKIVVTTG
jgi:NADPH:quinone reductase